MKLCLMILSVPWYMFNRGTEDTPLHPLSLFLGGGGGANVPSAPLWIRHCSLQVGAGPRFGEKPLKTTKNLGLGPPICPLF